MDFSSIDPVILIASLMVSSTSILLAATGELIVEKSSSKSRCGRYDDYWSNMWLHNMRRI